MTEPIELAADECRALLKEGMVGRVAFVTPSGPRIVPLNYVVIDDAIVFRTKPYSELGTYGRRAELAFETDDLDYSDRSGWSVVAVGPADVIDDPQEAHDILTATPLAPWVGGRRHLYFRLRWRELTGRRLLPVTAAV